MIFSSIPWDFLWQRHQQIASRLAKKGFDILYFQNPIYLNPNELIRNYKDGNIFLMKKVMKHLYVVNLFLPDFRGRFKFFAEKPGLLIFKLHLKHLNFKPDIAIFYSIQFVFLLDALRLMKVKILYDCVDEISGFSNLARAGSAILEAEENLIKTSSTIIASSKTLHEKISKIRSGCVYVPNAVDFEHFNSATQTIEKPPEIKNVKRPIVGFIGAVYDWINVDLLCRLAESHPDYSILLVGPVNFGLDKLKKYSNVIMVGAKKYELLPPYLSFMDVCLIPFKINKLTRASNPIKLYEYLAAGKPVVSTALPEVYNNASEIVYIGKDDDDFIKKVEKAVNESKSENKLVVSKRISYARENSWEKRIKTIEKLLSNTQT